MADIRSKEDFEYWLDGKPPELITILTLRCALRILPLSAVYNASHPEIFLNLILQVFRCISSTYGICLELFEEEEVSRVAHDADFNLGLVVEAFDKTASAGNISSYCVEAIYSNMWAIQTASISYGAHTNRDVTLVFASQTVDIASQVPLLCAASNTKYLNQADAFRALENTQNVIDPIFWDAVSADYAAINDGISATDLVSSKLWPSLVPKWFSIANSSLKTLLLPLNQNWDVWINWFDDRINGVKADEVLEMRRPLIPQEDWDKGAVHVNALIRKLGKRDQTQTLFDFVEKIVDPIFDKKLDFFISYNSKQENYARWFDALLVNAGYNNFAQFKDIAVGNNFVVEMNKGLEGTSRFLAILSPEYKASTHCQAEWSAAYNSDPDGSKAKLIGTLVQKYELDSLLKQLVYVDLTNHALSPKEAAQKLLDAVGYKGNFPEIPENWPGTLDLDAGNDASGRVVIIAPRADGRLESRPIPAQPDKDYGFSTPDLLAQMHSEIVDFANQTKYSSGQFTYSDRLKRSDIELEDISRLFSDGITGQNKLLTLNSKLRKCLQILSLDTRDGCISENDEIKLDEANLRAAYAQLANLFPELKTYRAANARDKFVLPTDEEAEALSKTTDDLSNLSLSGDVVSASLASDIKSAGDAIIQANEFVAGSSVEDKAVKKDLQIDAHMENAKKTIAIWSWIANARDKFQRSGKNVEELSKTIESYETLYGKLSVAALAAIKYYSKWFL